jgi:hypothetical protein
VINVGEGDRGTFASLLESNKIGSVKEGKKKFSYSNTTREQFPGNERAKTWMPIQVLFWRNDICTTKL